MTDGFRRSAYRGPTGESDRRLTAGFTVIELLVITVIIGILAGIAIPKYHAMVDRANTAKAIQEIRGLEIELTTYYAGAGAYPPDLATIGRAAMLDPWGNPYQYLALGSGPPGQARKDRFLVPVNSDYDLYSMGPDGASQAPFTARASRDDIVRANDGGYVGVAADY